MYSFMSVENRNSSEDTIKNLNDAIKNDWKLSVEEKKAFIEAYQNDKQRVIQESQTRKSELWRLIYNEYKNTTQRLIGVKWIQKAQRLLWLSADGKFGPKTVTKVIEFQLWCQRHDSTIKVDGILGKETLAFLVNFHKDFHQKQEWENTHIEQKELSKVSEYIQKIQDSIQYVERAPEEVFSQISAFASRPVSKFETSIDFWEDGFKNAKERAKEEGKNPTYKEFQKLLQELSTKEKEQFQAVVGAKVDGKPWLGSYTHYINSNIYEAGFSVEEAATYKRINGEEVSEQIDQINTAFSIDIYELPYQIGAWDIVKYDPNYWELIFFDVDTKKEIKIDVTDGIFDTIKNVFMGKQKPETIFTTLNQLQGSSERLKNYIQVFKEYIHEHDAQDIAREILCQKQETEKGSVYTLDFRENKMLAKYIVAQDIFGDAQYVQSAKHTYINRQQPSKDFKTFDNTKRLSLVNGTNVLIPNETETANIQKHMDLLERQAEIRATVETNLETTLTQSNTQEARQAIYDYLDMSVVRESEKYALIHNIQQLVFEKRLFSNMRALFTTQRDGKYVFTPWHQYLEKKLTAFDLFGDYTKLEVDGDEYASKTQKYYTNQEKKLILKENTEIVIQEGAQRSKEWFDKLQGIESLSESWKKIYKKFLQKLSKKERREVELWNKPFSLVDAKTKKMIFVDGSETLHLSIIIWQSGTTKWKYVRNDKKTPLWMVHRFNVVKFWRGKSILKKEEVYIPELMPADNGNWKDLRYNKKVQSYYGKKYDYKNKIWKTRRVTVTGVSIQSNEANSYGGRYFHGVGPNRNGTWGCIWIRYEDREKLKTMAKIIEKKKWFGYVDTP